MKVFKFGGASVNSAEAVRNMASIVQRYGDQRLVVVVSAMGKTTNLLERMVPGVSSLDDLPALITQLKEYHLTIAHNLFPTPECEVFDRLQQLFNLLEEGIYATPTTYNYDYDQTVSFGELISTTIISEYLNSIGIANQWVDIRGVITTDTNYREGRVDWEATRQHALNMMQTSCNMIVTQGFIAGTHVDTTTTLGREGSDYSAAILSYCLDAESMTIWKDVPGFLNADPKYFADTVKMTQIPYNEAIELAYYGASVIHPKTVKPVHNKQIAIHVKSFITPDAEGSVIGSFQHIVPETPLYIVKNNQLLLSIQPKDFSFIAEDNLQIIFGYFAQVGIRVNVMQNSALSFSVCIDNNAMLLEPLLTLLQENFRVRYNNNVQLITIRYYTQAIIDSIVGNRQILLEQRSRTTEQIVVANQ